MNVIFTCGGTGGHINPAIAVANILKERHPDAHILFLGAERSMELELVPRAGYEIVGLPYTIFERELSLAGLKYNLQGIGKIRRAVKKCREIFRDFQPDVVIGTGGYASFPALYTGHRLGIPICVHESNAVPGLTTKMVARWADVMMVAMEESGEQYKRARRVETVGMPVRREFIYTPQEDAKKALGLSGPVVVSTFGSQGAKAMNEMIAGVFALEQQDGFPFHHIHGVGSYGWEWMPERVRSLGVDWEHCCAIDMREYIYDMPTVMAAADIVISRAGASTCNEIAASGTPCIIIPSPNVTNNHQLRNAQAYAAREAAVLVEEKDCTPDLVYRQITELLADGSRRQHMRKRLLESVVPDSAERICDILEELAKGQKP